MSRVEARCRKINSLETSKSAYMHGKNAVGE